MAQRITIKYLTMKSLSHNETQAAEIQRRILLLTPNSCLLVYGCHLAIYEDDFDSMIETIKSQFRDDAAEVVKIFGDELTWMILEYLPKWEPIIMN